MKKLLLASLLVVYFICGCAGNTGAQVSALKSSEDGAALAQKLVSEIFSLYDKFDLQSFSDAVADDFIPMRGEFINRVDQNAHAGTVLDIKFSLDGVLRNKDLLVATIAWQKRSRPKNTTQVVLAQGKAQFNFKNVSGKWLLYQVTGDNPF